MVMSYGLLRCFTTSKLLGSWSMYHEVSMVLAVKSQPLPLCPIDSHVFHQIPYMLLVGGFNHLEIWKSMGRIIPFIMENTKCLKPPTSHLYHLYMGVHAPFSDKPNSLPALCFLLRSWHISVRTSGLWGHQTRKTLLSLGRESELVTENPSRIHGSMGFKWKKNIENLGHIRIFWFMMIQNDLPGIILQFAMEIATFKSGTSLPEGISHISLPSSFNQYFWILKISGWWLSHPSWKIWKSLGMIIPNILWKNKIHVPNHQPVVL